jgi:hypothetical protein
MGFRSCPSLAASSAETPAKAAPAASEVRQSAASVFLIMIIIAPKKLFMTVGESRPVGQKYPQVFIEISVPCG